VARLWEFVRSVDFIPADESSFCTICAALTECIDPLSCEDDLLMWLEILNKMLGTACVRLPLSALGHARRCVDVLLRKCPPDGLFALTIIQFLDQRRLLAFVWPNDDLSALRASFAKVVPKTLEKCH
jgi:hypothetical protein